MKGCARMRTHKCHTLDEKASFQGMSKVCRWYVEGTSKVCRKYVDGM